MSEIPFRSIDTSAENWKLTEEKEKAQPVELHNVALSAREDLRDQKNPDRHQYYMVEGEDRSQGEPFNRALFVQWINSPEGKRMSDQEVAAYNGQPNKSMRIMLDHIDAAPNVDNQDRRIYFGQVIEN